MYSSNDETEVMELGRLLNKLMNDNVFQKAILEGFIAQGRLDLTKRFDGSVDAIEGLKAISYFEDWIEESIEYAKTIQNERIDNGK